MSGDDHDGDRWKRGSLWDGPDAPDVDPGLWDEERAERDREDRLQARFVSWMAWLSERPDLKQALEKAHRWGRKCAHLKSPDNCMWCDDIEASESNAKREGR